MATQDRLPLVLCGMFYDLWLDPNKRVYRNSKNLREKLIIRYSFKGSILDG